MNLVGRKNNRYYQSIPNVLVRVDTNKEEVIPALPASFSSTKKGGTH